MQGTRINRLKLWHDINKWQTIFNNTTKIENIEKKAKIKECTNYTCWLVYICKHSIVFRHMANYNIQDSFSYEPSQIIPDFS